MGGGGVIHLFYAVNVAAICRIFCGDYLLQCFNVVLLWCCATWIPNVYNVKRSFLIVDTDGGNPDTPRAADYWICGFML